MFDSIIFDIDGTIWDSTSVVAEAYNSVFEKEKLEKRVTADELKNLFGKTMDVIFDILFPELGKSVKVRLQQQCIVREDILLRTKAGKFYDGIVETIAKLSEKYPVYIVSNAQRGYIEEVMEHGGFEKYIKAHLCFGDTGTGKGETIRILMRQEDISDPVYIGDIQDDADACKEAGIEIIHAAYGFGNIEKPYARIMNPAQLLTIL